MRIVLIAAMLAAAWTATPTLAAGGLPTRVGQCVATRIKAIGNRLENSPGSGSSVTLANGGYQVSYDQVPAVDRSRAGDPVSMCLVSVPSGCPKGDSRGKMYRTTNLRTHASWSLQDSEHLCGGA